MERELIIESLREQNPWWIYPEMIENDEKVQEALSKNKKLIYSFSDASNTLIFGPRQVGKTTYFKLLIYDLIINKKENPKKIAYFSCDILKDYQDILEMIRTIKLITPENRYIFLDEISFVEEWQRAVKYMLDSGIIRNKVVYITGSSSINLRKESFPGRDIKIREFMPLSFRDFCLLFGSQNLKTHLENMRFEFKDLAEISEKVRKLLPFQDELDYLFLNFLECGGFPKAFYEHMENDGIKNSTYETYWKWIIYDIAKIGKSEKIVNGVLRGILKNYGCKFSLNSIAKETEIGSHTTVREYMEILEDLYIIRNFHHYDIFRGTIVHRKMRKAYFVDPFLYHVVQRMIFGIHRPEYPAIVEGIVAETLTRRFGKNRTGFYYGKKEIDVCFGDFGIEVKWQEKVDARDFPKIDMRNKIILSKRTFDFYGDGVLIIPVSMFLALI